MNIDSILVVILKVFKKSSSKEANLNISNSQERKRPYIQTVDYGLISLKLKPSVKYSVTWHAETLLAYNFIYRCFVLLLSCLLCFLVLYSPMVKVIECENIILKTEQKITYVTQLEQAYWTYRLSPGPSSSWLGFYSEVLSSVPRVVDIGKSSVVANICLNYVCV